MSIDLFSPLKLGDLTLKNRVLMAPCTRCRAGAGQAPTAPNAEYYAQRASAGLIISEATQISLAGRGYPNTPGMHTPEQVGGWKLVTDAVHQKGGLIFAQLWHCGRVSANAYQPDGLAPFSSSAVDRGGTTTLPDGSSVPSPIPRAMSEADIRATIDDYAHAAKCAKEAGFDGVELHGANGYLPDQFLRDGVNKRTDSFGGSPANRAKFHVLAVKALVSVFGAGRVGVRLSPSGTFNAMSDSDPWLTFSTLVKELDTLNLAYLHIMEAMESDVRHGKDNNARYQPIPVGAFRPITKTPIITNAGFTYETATRYIQQNQADAIAFGIPFIANPDLPARFAKLAKGEKDVPFNTPQPQTFYGQGAAGYTDYPALPS